MSHTHTHVHDFQHMNKYKPLFILSFFLIKYFNNEINFVDKTLNNYKKKFINKIGKINKKHINSIQNFNT